MWMVRTPGGQFAQELLKLEVVAIGWPRATGQLNGAKTPKDFYEVIRKTYPEYPEQKVINTGSRNAYAKKVYVDRAFQKKTNELVQKHIGAEQLVNVAEFVKIDENTIELIKKQKGGDSTKVINLVKSIEKAAEDSSNDPFLIALAERAMAVQTAFEDRQTSTAEALGELIKEVERNEKRKKEQAAKGLDAIGYFVLTRLETEGIKNADATSRKVAESFTKFPNWRTSEGELRELRKQVTFALLREEDDVEKVTAIVEGLFTLLRKGFKL